MNLNAGFPVLSFTTAIPKSPDSHPTFPGKAHPSVRIPLFSALSQHCHRKFQIRQKREARTFLAVINSFPAVRCENRNIYLFQSSTTGYSAAFRAKACSPAPYPYSPAETFSTHKFNFYYASGRWCWSFLRFCLSVPVLLCFSLLSLFQE